MVESTNAPNASAPPPAPAPGAEAAAWSMRWTRWSQRLHKLGLAGVIETLLDAAEPLGPLGAQLLWVAQPTLSLFMPRGEITALAHSLEEPGGVARLRAQLLNANGTTVTESPDEKDGIPES